MRPPGHLTEADIENSYYAAVINLLFEAAVSENSIADYELLMTAAVMTLCGACLHADLILNPATPIYCRYENSG